MKYTFAIGDVHGCNDQLLELLQKIDVYRNEKGISYLDTKLIFLGDYVDRGPNSKGVLDTVLDLKNKYPGEVITLMGNHEDMMLEGRQMWYHNGGFATVESFGGESVYQKNVKPYVPMIRELPLYHDDGLRFFVHAGVYPDAPPDMSDKSVMLWVRDEFLRSEYIWNRLIVHGHTPTGVEVKDNRVNLDSACVFGHKLSCGVFTDYVRNIVDLIQVDGLPKKVGSL